MGSREERLLSEQLQRMADLGVEPVALPPVGDGPAEEIAGGDVGGSPDTSEEGPTREDGPSSPAMPACEIPDGYIGLRNGSIGPADEPAVTPAEERMIFGAPVNRTVAEVEATDSNYRTWEGPPLRTEGLSGNSDLGAHLDVVADDMAAACTCPPEIAAGGAHGSPELDADAEKLIAMGQDPGPTLEDLDDLPFSPEDFVPHKGDAAPAVTEEDIQAALAHFPPPDHPDFAEVEGAEPGGAEPFVEIPLKPAWAVGDLCLYDDHLAEVFQIRDDGTIDIDVWTVALKKGTYEWDSRARGYVDPSIPTAIESDYERLFAAALLQHKVATAAESAASEAHRASDRLLRAHYALAEAVGALALVGKAVKVADAESTAA